MRWQSGLAIYFLFWFLCIFFVLPFHARTSDEVGGAKVPGQADSAPHRFPVWRVIGWTTLVASALFALFVANYIYGWVTAEMLDLTRR
jgi:predicted secreted protein